MKAPGPTPVGSTVYRQVGEWHPRPLHVEPPALPARQSSMDKDDREAARELGLDPDDPAVIAGFDFVRWELGMFLPDVRGD